MKVPSAMSRRALIVRPRKLTIHLPEDVAVRLDLFLYSAAQQRIPFGSYQRFFVERVNEFLAQTKLVNEHQEELTKAEVKELRKAITE